GANSGSSTTLCGPVRRSSMPAIEVLQLCAAIWRWASVIVTCINFSASAKVAGATSGPTGGAVPKVGGAPGGGCSELAAKAWLTANMPTGAVMRKRRRVFIVLASRREREFDHTQ